jgi:hypothetical protein
MSRLSQQKIKAANIIETAFSEEYIHGLLEILNINTSRSINIVQEIDHSLINQNILSDIPNDSCIGENQILLNFKQGQATVDQVFDNPLVI